MSPPRSHPKPRPRLRHRRLTPRAPPPNVPSFRKRIREWDGCCQSDSPVDPRWVRHPHCEHQQLGVFDRVDDMPHAADAVDVRAFQASCRIVRVSLPARSVDGRGTVTRWYVSRSRTGAELARSVRWRFRGDCDYMLGIAPGAPDRVGVGSDAHPRHFSLPASGLPGRDRASPNPTPSQSRGPGAMLPGRRSGGAATRQSLPVCDCGGKSHGGQPSR